MKVKLVFEDWRNAKNESVYSTKTGVELSMGDFHSGATFNATIEVDDPKWLEEQLSKGFKPVFYIVKNK